VGGICWERFSITGGPVHAPLARASVCVCSGSGCGVFALRCISSEPLVFEGALPILAPARPWENRTLVVVAVQGALRWMVSFETIRRMEPATRHSATYVHYICTLYYVSLTFTSATMSALHDSERVRAGPALRTTATLLQGIQMS
jgi:hypothetical protein